MSLELLRQFATGNNTSKAVHTLSLEAARDAVQIKDSNKIQRKDGGEALSLYLGKYVLELTAIGKGVTKIQAPQERVADFRNQLKTHVMNGVFDESLKEAQAKSRATAEKIIAAKYKETNVEPKEDICLN